MPATRSCTSSGVSPCKRHAIHRHSAANRGNRLDQSVGAADFGVTVGADDEQAGIGELATQIAEEVE